MADPIYDNLTSQFAADPIVPQSTAYGGDQAPPSGTIGPTPAVAAGGSLPGLLGRAAMAGAGKGLSAVGGVSDKIPEILLQNPGLAFTPMGLGALPAYMMGQQAKATGGALSDWAEGSPPMDFSESLTNPSVNREQLLNLSALAPGGGKAGGALARDLKEGELGRALWASGASWIQDFHKLSGPLPSEPGYLYHASNSRLANAARVDGLKTEGPFTPTADYTWRFIPKGSQKLNKRTGLLEDDPVILRVRQDAHPFKQESTGDFYTDQVIPAKHIEFLTARDQTWQPLVYPPEKIIHESIPGGRYGRSQTPHYHEEYKTPEGARLAGTRDPSTRVLGRPDIKGTLQTHSAHTPPAWRSRDHMTALIKRAVDDATARGETYFSDRTISDLQQPSYLAMRDLGYTVIVHPHDGPVEPGRDWWSATGNMPGIFEIHPPSKQYQLPFDEPPPPSPGPGGGGGGPPPPTPTDDQRAGLAPTNPRARVSPEVSRALGFDPDALRAADEAARGPSIPAAVGPPIEAWRGYIREHPLEAQQTAAVPRTAGPLGFDLDELRRQSPVDPVDPKAARPPRRKMGAPPSVRETQRRVDPRELPPGVDVRMMNQWFDYIRTHPTPGTMEEWLNYLRTHPNPGVSDLEE